MFPIFKALVLSLSIAAGTTNVPEDQAPLVGGDVNIPTHADAELTYTSVTTDPDTGNILIVGDVVLTGTFGKLTGTDSYEINPVTGTFVGTGTRVAANGSTYTVSYIGQFVSATDTVGTYTYLGGTGHFAKFTAGSGTFSSSRWADGSGSSSVIAGTATIGK